MDWLELTRISSQTVTSKSLPEEVKMKRVLVVDDDTDTLDFLRILLKQQGYEIYTAQDGSEALEVIATQSVDLILSDVAMPYLNGYELCQRIKHAPDPRLLLTPVILMSGRTLDSDIRYAKSLGADDYLPKPLDVDDLLAVVQGRLLAAERLQSLFEHGTNGAAVTTLIINEKSIRIDYRQHRVWVEDHEVELTAREVFLLERLARQPNEVVSLVEMVKATHNLTTDSQEAGQLLRPLIRTLRRKLEVHLGEVPCIKNVRSRGYMLIANTN
jgi:DNA-binding response OmpR family regulator